MREETIIFEPSFSFEEGCQFTRDKSGLLIVSVAEEQAVDSYNQSFECTAHLTPDQAVQLRDWLNKQFPARP